MFESKSMIEDESNERDKCPIQFFRKIPKEIIKKIFFSFQKNNVLDIRRTSKEFKNIIDVCYWDHYKINIATKSSFPAIQDIRNIPFASIVFSFEKWRQKDIEELLLFKKITTLHFKGMPDWNFSTNELFNPMPCAYMISYILSILNVPICLITGVDLCTPPIFKSVTSLDLSNNIIGDYGVICFISKFKKLKFLNISNNDIGRNIISEVNVLAEMNTLVSLNISKNNFNNETISYIDRLKNLTYLDISYNPISEYVIIKRLSSLPKLTHFINEGKKSY